MRKIQTFMLLAATFVVGLASADTHSAADAQLDNVIADYWELYLQTYPAAATGAGVYEFNDQLGSVTPASQERVLQANRILLARARDINRAEMSLDGQVNVDLLIWELEDTIGATELGLSPVAPGCISNSL